MSNDDHDTGAHYMVLVNDEEQYSLWHTSKALPNGWRDVGVYGSKEDCLAHVERVWTDITPLSVRKRLESMRSGGG